MTIYEAGILFRGFTLINSLYQESSKSEVDKDLRSGLISAIIIFAENAFSSSIMEYLEGTKFVIAFTQEQIMAVDSYSPETLIGYAILGKRKKIERYIQKKIQPLLNQCVLYFKEKYEGFNLSMTSQFDKFKEYLDSKFLPEKPKIKTIV